MLTVLVVNDWNRSGVVGVVRWENDDNIGIPVFRSWRWRLFIMNWQSLELTAWSVVIGLTAAAFDSGTVTATDTAVDTEDVSVVSLFLCAKRCRFVLTEAARIGSGYGLSRRTIAVILGGFIYGKNDNERLKESSEKSSRDKAKSYNSVIAYHHRCG